MKYREWHITKHGVVEVYIMGDLRPEAEKIVARARIAKVHVLLCTPDDLPLGCVTQARAWIDFAYHLCIRLDRGKRHKTGARKRFERPFCHGLRSKAIPVR